MRSASFGLSVLIATVGVFGGSGGRGPSTVPVHGSLRELGGPVPGLNRGVPGTIEADTLKGRAVTKVAARGNGSFTLGLPPGTYRLFGDWESSRRNCFGPTVHVGSKPVDHVVVRCEIR